MIYLRKAEIKEAEEILNFYQGIIDSVKGSEFQPKWGEYYPDLEFIKASIEKGELYVCSKDNRIISSIVLNNRFNPEYENVDWIVDANPDEITIIHAFAVDFDFAGKGIGKAIFNQIENDCLEDNKKAIRLDIIDGNIGAQKVFEKLGFEYVGSAEVFHDAVGLEKFNLYEYALKKER